MEEGLEAALHRHKPNREYEKLADEKEAHLTALACSEAPAGHGRCGSCGTDWSNSAL